jgi:hypothetical protein
MRQDSKYSGPSYQAVDFVASAAGTRRGCLLLLLPLISVLPWEHLQNAEEARLLMRGAATRQKIKTPVDYSNTNRYYVLNNHHHKDPTFFF